MTYISEQQEIILFDDTEEAKIDKWLTDNGYKWDRATVCGGCCGFYADEYWVNGIGGEFKKEDVERFLKFAKKKGIFCKVSDNDIQASRAE